jgi:hypothetical protein
MNTRMLELLGNQPGKYPTHLETHFPHVFQKVLELWNTAEGERYFDELMLSKRAGREGFPPEATVEIWGLHQIHAGLRESQKARQDNDLWASGADDAHHSRLSQELGK